jgi:hypothetical protein
VLAVVAAASTAAQDPTLTAGEYEVLSAVIAHGLPAGTGTIAVSARTTGDPDSWLPPGPELPELAKRLEIAPALLAGWTALNRQRAALEPRLLLAPRFELVPDDLRARLFAGEEPAQGWARFHARFPQAPGLLSVSRVAIDEERRNAVVYVEFACGPECGTGRLVHLARGEGGWQVIGGELIWIAGS